MNFITKLIVDWSRDIDPWLSGLISIPPSISQLIPRIHFLAIPRESLINGLTPITDSAPCTDGRFINHRV